MPTEVQCPECSGKLRVGDSLLGKKVKCPRCKAVFTAREADDVEEVEDVEEEEARPKKAARRSRDDDDDDDRFSEERPKKSRRRDDDDDDDDDRPRKKRRDEDDEDDDRPRSRRRRDNDDDDDDRPKKPKKNVRAQLEWSQLAALLIWIGAIVNLAAVGLMTLLHLLGMFSYHMIAPAWVTLLLVGLPAMGGMATFLTGLVFGILGPKTGAILGMSIAMTATGGLHFLFAIVCAIPQASGFNFDFGQVTIRSANTWARAASALPAFASLTGGLDPMYFMAGLFEVAHFVLFFLWARFLMQYYDKKASLSGSIVGISLSGGAAVLIMVVGLIHYAVVSSAGFGTGMQVMYWLGFFFDNGAIIAVWVFTLLFAADLRSFLDYQRPK